MPCKVCTTTATSHNVTPTAHPSPPKTRKRTALSATKNTCKKQKLATVVKQDHKGGRNGKLAKGKGPKWGPNRCMMCLFFLLLIYYIYLGTLLPVLSRMPRSVVLQLTLPRMFPALYLPPQPLTHYFRAEQALGASGIGVVPPRQHCSTGVTHLPKISTTSHLRCLDLTKNKLIKDHKSEDQKPPQKQGPQRQG